MIRALIPLVDGCEEMEVVILADVLRRAGWTVTLAGLNGMEPVTASRGVRLLPDEQWEMLDLLSYDVILLPGGMGGTKNLCAHEGVQETLRIFDIGEKWIAAICAAPLALYRAGVLDGRAFTCYPGVEEQTGRSDRLDVPVVVDGHVVTSQGPGTAIALAIELIRQIDSPATADSVASGLLYEHGEPA